MILFPDRKYTFVFLTEEELSSIPMPLGDGFLYPGGHNYNLIINAPKGTDINNPIAGTVYTSRATFVSRLDRHNYFHLQGGYVSVDEGSDIYDITPSVFMTTCGSGHELCPGYGDRGTFYMYIDSVTSSSINVRFFWLNDNGAAQSVYADYVKPLPVQRGIKIIKRRTQSDKCNSSAYDLHAIFHVYDSSKVCWTDRNR